MGGVLDWSTTPDSNTTVDGVSIAEGMQAGLVNNGMRAIMALVREWQLDASGVVTAGAGDAYTITSNQGIAAYADGLRFSFRADRNNTGAATLNVDGRGAKALRKTAAGALTALAADDLVAEAVYDVVYDVSSDVFVLVNSPAPEVLPGLTATVTELNYTDGVTSAIQTQLNAKAPTIADPNADRIRFWDDSAGAEAWLEVGTGLAVSGTTLSASLRTVLGPFATTSGSSVSATGIPAGTKRVTVVGIGVQLSASASVFRVQIGPSGGVETTGYAGASTYLYGNTTGGGAAMTTGFSLDPYGADELHYLTFNLVNVAGNIWSFDGTCSADNRGSVVGNGVKTLADTITQLNLSISGAGSFSAGSFYVICEV